MLCSPYDIIPTPKNIFFVLHFSQKETRLLNRAGVVGFYDDGIAVQDVEHFTHKQ